MPNENEIDPHARYPENSEEREIATLKSKLNLFKAPLSWLKGIPTRIVQSTEMPKKDTLTQNISESYTEITSIITRLGQLGFNQDSKEQKMAAQYLQELAQVIEETQSYHDFHIS